jgi:iron complex outermembrane receptor protein
VPRWLANLDAEWQVPTLQGLSLNTRWIYTGKQYANLGNQLTLSSWNRFDVGARYVFSVNRQTYTLRAAIENIANKAYWASASPDTSISQLSQGNPRTFRLSASIDF